MKGRPRRRLLMWGLFPILGTMALSLMRPSFLMPLEYRAYDTVLRSADTRPHAVRSRPARTQRS
jgi:hypothetical protein